MRSALEADAGYAVWAARERETAAADRSEAERLQRVREEMKTGKRKRLHLPELDRGL